MVKIHTFPNFPDYSSEDGVSRYLISFYYVPAYWVFKNIMYGMQIFFHKSVGYYGGNSVRHCWLCARNNEFSHSFRLSLKVVLVYPSDGAVPMTTMSSSRAAEIRKMVFIDSTWAQAKQIYKDPRLKGKFVVFAWPSMHKDVPSNKGI